MHCCCSVLPQLFHFVTEPRPSGLESSTQLVNFLLMICHYFSFMKNFSFLSHNFMNTYLQRHALSASAFGKIIRRRFLSINRCSIFQWKPLLFRSQFRAHFTKIRVPRGSNVLQTIRTLIWTAKMTARWRNVDPFAIQVGNPKNTEAPRNTWHETNIWLNTSCQSVILSKV